MASMMLLRNLLIAEKLTGIYRDFSIQNHIRKYFIMFHVFCLTMLHTGVLLYKLYLFISIGGFSGSTFIYCGFFITSYVLCVSCTFSGIFCSHAFMSYVKSINTFFDLFKDDTIFNSSIKKVYWFCVMHIVTITIYILYRCIEVNFSFSNPSQFIFYPTLASQFVTRMSIILHQVIMTYVILNIFYSSNCLYSRILEVLIGLVVCEGDSGKRYVTREQIESWVDLYQNLVNCCERVTPCFGWQFLFTLIMTVLNHMIASYQLCYILITSGDYRKLQTLGFIMISYIILTFLPILAGHRIYRQGAKFQRIMARLYNSIAAFDFYEPDAKLLKDFIRLIKKKPLQIKLISKIPVGMYMLPVLFAIGTNYVITMLQFNHVI